MDFRKKLVISTGWIAVGVAATFAVVYLRRIGTAWMNNPGFFRMIGLTLFCVLFIAAPAILAVLAWAGRPKTLYRKLGNK